MFQHNVQHIALRGKASASTARKLIAMQQAPCTTLFDADIEQTVSARVSFQDQIIAGLPAKANSIYYLVASPKFAHRFYVVVKQGTRYVCSSREAQVQKYCSNLVAQYASDAKAALAA